MGPGRTGIFSILFDRVMHNQFIPLIGSGKNLFQFTPVKDLVEVSIKVMDLFNNEIVNVGCQHVLPVREELTMLIKEANSSSSNVSVPVGLACAVLQLAEFFGISSMVKDQFRIAHKDFVLDYSKAQKLLGWNPSQTNFEALLSAYTWYKDHVDIIGRQYSGWAGLLGKFRHSKMGAYQK